MTSGCFEPFTDS